MQNKTATISKKFPTKPITIIVPFSAGGAMDLIARSLEKAAPNYLGQPLVVINKPGGTGTIAYNELVSATPDGYTVGITGIELLLQPLYGPTKYHYPTALDPLVQISSSPFIMVITNDQPWQNTADLIQYTKQHPGQLKFGHVGIGSLPHVIGETFAKYENIIIEQVPFRGGSEVVTSLLGKHIQIAFLLPSSVKEHITSGRIRALAVSGEQRLTDPVLAQIPTFKEQGIDISFNIWFAIAAPKSLPPEVKTKLTEGFKAIIDDQEFKTTMDNIGMRVDYLGPQESEARWLSDSTKLTKAVQETGILDLIKAQKN